MRLFACGAIASALLMTAGTVALAQSPSSSMNTQGQSYGVSPPSLNGASRASSNEGQNGQTIYHSGVLNAQMGEPEIKSILRDEGYSNFHDVSQKNGAYTIKSAKLYGTKVHNLVVDEQTAQVENPQPINEDQAKNLLKDKGFSNVKHVNKNRRHVHRRGHHERSPGAG
jgi:hypothetical protein